jgi:hypothetical protein
MVSFGKVNCGDFARPADSRGQVAGVPKSDTNVKLDPLESPPPVHPAKTKIPQNRSQRGDTK